MATRGWGTSIALAVGVAAGASAAQLGFGYGLGIMPWTSATGAAGDTAWLASLAWTTWIAATSTVLGAIVADRLSGGQAGAAPPSRRPGSAPPGPLATTAWRLVLALTAGIGGLLTVPLVAVPARATHRADTISPQLVAGGYAVAGVAVGLAIAIGALSARAVAANVIATTAWLWVLALASAIKGVAAGGGDTTAQLAIWRFGTGHFIRQTFSLPGAALMMGSALAIGVLAAWPALRRSDNPVGVAISGAAGPVVVAAAYFLAAPKLVGQPDEQLSAYLIAPYAVIAGLAGSVFMTALLTQRKQRLSALAAPVPAPRADAAEPDGALDTGSGDAALDDEYAPARAYEEPASVGASTGTPLWPDSSTGKGSRRSGDATVTLPGPDKATGSEADGGTEESKPSRKGRFRRG